MTDRPSYIPMITTARLNYRSSCDFTADSIVGILELNTTVQAIVGYREYNCGHYWRKIKIGRKHFFAADDWLQTL